jgi:hypothetical protein
MELPINALLGKEGTMTKLRMSTRIKEIANSNEGLINWSDFMSTLSE